jgi:hypothetical protein
MLAGVALVDCSGVGVQVTVEGVAIIVGRLY